MTTLYSLVTDDSSGTETMLFMTEAERDARCTMICAAAWSDAEITEPLPTDWRLAWERLESDGCDFWLSMDEHRIISPAEQLAEAFADFCTSCALDGDGDLILPGQDDGSPHPLVQLALKLAKEA